MNEAIVFRAIPLLTALPPVTPIPSLRPRAVSDRRRPRSPPHFLKPPVSTLSSGASLEDTDEYGLRPRGRLWPRRFELTARSGKPWSQKGGTVVTRLRRVTKASDSMVSPRRLRPSWGGDLALTKGTFLAMLVMHYTRLGGLVANSAQAGR